MDIRFGFLSDVRSFIWVSCSSSFFRRHGSVRVVRKGVFIISAKAHRLQRFPCVPLESRDANTYVTK